MWKTFCYSNLGYDLEVTGEDPLQSSSPWWMVDRWKCGELEDEVTAWNKFD